MSHVIVKGHNFYLVIYSRYHIISTDLLLIANLT
jgi:hypothetical protein